MPAQPEMEPELDAVVRILVQNRWPWRLHATYDEKISRALDVFERVNQDMPLDGLRIDAPCDPPFRGSHERRDRTTYFQHASAVR